MIRSVKYAIALSVWAAAPSFAAARTPDVVRLPLESVRGWIATQVCVGCDTCRMIFDTGCGITIVSQSVSERANARSADAWRVTDSNGFKVEYDACTLPRVRAQGFAVDDLTALVMPDSAFLMRCAGVDGVIGGNMLRRCAVRISLRDTSVKIAPAAKRLLDKSERRRGCKMRLRGNTPNILVEAGGFATECLFDTGDTGLSLDRERFDRLTAAGAVEQVRSARGFHPNMGAAQRFVHDEMSRGAVREAVVAGVALKSVPCETTSGRNRIGLDLLLHGDIVVDYARSRFWFLPFDAGEIAMKVPPVPNLLPSFDAGRGIVVGSVWDEDLADEVRAGDRITFVEDIPASSIDLCTYFSMRWAGREIRVLTERGEKRITIRFMDF